MGLKYSNNAETLIIFGTYKRREICLKSLRSLTAAIKDYDVKLIISDGTPNEPLNQSSLNAQVDDYIWTPKLTNMATSRNIALRLAKDKYTYDWIMFLEDDLMFKENWYPELLSFASKCVDKQSPFGLAYGSFSAVPNGVKRDDTSLYDSKYDCYAGLFGLRADQRLYKSCHYHNIGIMWDSDILGISSCQTGKLTHRSLMRGYVSGGIGHRNLCYSLDPDNDQSTWLDERDIGPAAFDKRLEGYESIKLTAKQFYSDSKSYPKESSEIKKIDKNSKEFNPIKPISKKPMTSILPKEKFSLKRFIKRFYNAFKIITTGRY